ncbi:MAG: peptidase T [Candidatus Faecousia sp.]|nr:peptidase T [Candidatus Faecousia sp.]
MNVTQRFLHYVSFDTQSDESSPSCPSTPKQRLLGQALVEEMQAMGIADARMDDNGYVYGSVPGTPGAPVIGLIAHMDTSPDCSGASVRPRVVEYQGGDVVLNEERQNVLRQADFPQLRRSVGKHLIVTDGTTLLGADDPAGIAEILTAVEELLSSGKSHAPVRIAFTPDEEIGRGADRFNLAGFGADYAYTADGGTLGEIEYENFNAASAKVVCHGRSIHPGSAKNKLINAQLLAMEFHAMLPVNERPEYTEGYEGFSMLTQMHGDVETAELHYIIRDHDREKFEQKKGRFSEIAAYLNRRWGDGAVELTVKDSYYNMKEKILPCMYVVERAKAAMAKAGMEPVAVPIRGGTDGAMLSFKGLPCPNLCTGGENYHGRFEYIPVEDMEACVRMLRYLLEDAAGARP